MYKVHKNYPSTVIKRDAMPNVLQDAFNPYYPQQPAFDPNCDVNELYQSLPPGNLSPQGPTAWESTAAGPSSIKHLYTGIPNWYPIRKITRPVNTLYGHDYSQFHQTGVGKGKRISYTYKPYPLTDRNVREVNVYGDYILPYMDFRAWTKHPVRRDASVNSYLHYHPNPYIPDRD